MRMIYQSDNARTGWVCPICWRAISPDLDKCPDCTGKAGLATITWDDGTTVEYPSRWPNDYVIVLTGGEPINE